uniref:Uncharacterized protein n=1 Tax=Anguilla anguilla TaxID=7936 RepID=A0A0E9UYV5_ANGAN
MRFAKVMRVGEKALVSFNKGASRFFLILLSWHGNISHFYLLAGCRKLDSARRDNSSVKQCD